MKGNQKTKAKFFDTTPLCVRQLLGCILLSVVLFLWSGFTIALPLPVASSSIATAASLLEQDSLKQTATLTGPKVDSPVPIYLRPAANQPNVGYGRIGDAVSVLEEFGDFLMEGDRAATWSHIRLDNPPYTEGWVRGTSLLFESEPD